MRKCCLAVFKVKVTTKAHMFKTWLFPVSAELLILLQPNFGFIAHHQKLGFIVKRLHCWVVFKVKVTAKVYNFIEFSPGPYLLNCWTFCNQTCYGAASSWARVSWKKIGLLFSRSRSLWGLIFRCEYFYHICWTNLLFLQPDLIWWYIIIFLNVWV